MLHKMIFRVFFVLALLSGAAEVRAQQLEADIVYESPELLTKSMLREHAMLVQALLDVQYNAEQTARHYQLVKEYWVKRDYTGIAGVKANLEFYKQLKQLPIAELKATVLSLRPALILNLIEDAAKREDSRWYLQNYYAIHPPIVKGNIPFIRETADALLDGELFISKELKGKAVQPLNKEQRDKAYAELARQWTSFDDDTRKQVMTGASQMSLIFYRWKQLGVEEKAQVKLHYVGERYLTPSEKSAVQQASMARAGSSGAQWGLIRNELDQMKRTTDIIMAKGIRWDPSLNRYVQEGGIVTEYW